jgi:hypothetical protein
MLMTREEIERKAPAIYSEHPSQHMSDRYDFVSTAEMIDKLAKFNWHPHRVDQQRTQTKSIARVPYKRHIVRFQNPNLQSDIQNIPEVVMVNSHDGSTPFKFYLGIFRLVCTNGLTIAKASFGQISFKHIGLGDDDIKMLLDNIAGNAEHAFGEIENMKKILLPDNSRTQFAKEAIKLKWTNGGSVEPNDLLLPRRKEDDKKDLWTTYNVVQENIMKGGVSYIANNNKMRHTKKMRNISEDIRFNMGLWKLVEQRLSEVN